VPPLIETRTAAFFEMQRHANGRLRARTLPSDVRFRAWLGSRSLLNTFPSFTLRYLRRWLTRAFEGAAKLPAKASKKAAKKAVTKKPGRGKSTTRKRRT
jgi:hypothetical protein